MLGLLKLELQDVVSHCSAVCTLKCSEPLSLLSSPQGSGFSFNTSQNTSGAEPWATLHLVVLVFPLRPLLEKTLSTLFIVEPHAGSTLGLQLLHLSLCQLTLSLQDPLHSACFPGYHEDRSWVYHIRVPTLHLTWPSVSA